MKACIVLLDGTVVEAEGSAQEIADLTEALRRSRQVERPEGRSHDECSVPIDPPDSKPEIAPLSSRSSDENDDDASDETEDDDLRISESDQAGILEPDGAEEQPEEGDLLRGETGTHGPPLDLAVREVADQFRLLADPTRLQILGLLADRGHNVGELCESLGGQSQPAVSHHLALLRVSGLVAPSREGKYNYYDLTDQGRTLTEAVGRFAASDMSGAVEAFRQAADPTRLQILAILSEGERNVGELCSDLSGMSQPAVSHHLALLRHGGLVESRRAGKFNYYSLRDEGWELTRMIAPMMGAKVRAAPAPPGEEFEAESIDISTVPDDWMNADPPCGEPTGEVEAPPSHMLCRRVLSMVQELHRRGYERLRIAPGLSPSGLYWRCSIVPIMQIRRDHGAMALDEVEVVARYGSGQGAEFFGWPDAEHDSPEALTDKFVERFPDLAAKGLGSDPEYARWYAGMLRATAPHGLVYAYADWDLPDDNLPALGCTVDVRVPMPPPGDGGLQGKER